MFEEDRTSALSARREKAACLARDLAPILKDIRSNGITSLNGIAAKLTEREVRTPRGSRAWSAFQVHWLAGDNPTQRSRAPVRISGGTLNRRPRSDALASYSSQ